MNKRKGKKKLFFLLLLHLIFNFQLSIFNCTAQSVHVHRERTFTASGLYGFMNGGTDLFLEYDVQKLVVMEVAYKGEEYSVEVYEMASPEDAFGIYSLHTFRCLRTDTLGGIDCLSPYQLQAVSGNCYVSVVFPSGSQIAKKNADELLRKYVSANKTKKPDIPDILQIQPPYSGNLKYIRGPISASNVSFSLAQAIENIYYKGIWFVSAKPSKEYKALVYLSDSKDKNKMKEKIPSENILKEGEDFIYISGTEEEPEDEHGDFGF